ncbi:hypothetical protein TNCV_1999631 [Trichonephila clavipes]|nr:hypothetical protein TNCV_1999631 [Trichonephila clavipes]
MGVEPGEFSVSAMKLLDRERLMKAIYALSGRSKKIRKDKRRKRKKEEDNIKKNKVKKRLQCRIFLMRTAMAGSDVVQSGRPIFDDFFQHLWPYIGNNTANVVFQMVKRLWLIRIDQ